MRPAHTSMLFRSDKKMDIEIWDSIPKTTNDQEAMHWKLYCMCGCDHHFLEGMYALFGVAEYYKRLMDAISSECECPVAISIGHWCILEGILIRYGAPEPWKAKAAAIGYTKPTQALKPDEKKHQKNDGQPPDTAKELLDNLALKKAAKLKETPPTAPKLGPSSYRWNANSCWLDASLQLLYVTVTKQFDEFKGLFQHIKPSDALGTLYQTINGQAELDLQEDTSALLMSQRDRLWIFMHEKKITNSLDNPESAVVSWNNFCMCSHLFFDQVWLPALVRLQYRDKYSLAVLYFLTFCTSLHQCSGSLASGTHAEIVSTLHCKPFFQVYLSLYKEYNGLITRFVKTVSLPQ